MSSVKRFLATYKVIVIAAFFAVLGFYLLIFGGIWEAIGLSLIPSAIITTVFEYYLRVDLYEKLGKIGILLKLERMGISNIYLKRRPRDPEILDIIARKPKVVKLLGLSLYSFRTLIGAEMDRLVRRGTVFQICYLKTDGEMIKRRSQQEIASIIPDVEATDAWLRRYAGQKNVKVKKHDIFLTCHICIIDDDRIYFNPYPTFGGGLDFPVFRITKKSPLFGKLKEHFELIWKEKSEPFINC